MRTLRLGFPSDERANVRGLWALTRAVLHRGGGQAPSPNPLGHPSRTPAYPGRGARGRSQPQGRAKRLPHPLSACHLCLGLCFCQGGDSGPSHRVGAKGLALGGSWDCSGFMLEETSAEPGLRTAVKGREKPFLLRDASAVPWRSSHPA